MKGIPLKQVLELGNLKDYKLHLACWNGIKQPLDVFLTNKKEWLYWSRWRSHQLNRKYILAFVNLYNDDDAINSWLFAGVYEVINKRGNENDIKELKVYNNLVGRLKITFNPGGRNRYLCLEKHYDSMRIREITKERIQSLPFKNYSEINLSFDQLEIITNKNLTDWKTALKNIKGIYLITDSENGKIYIGSAYGDYGIWSRWECYIKNGHGGNADLKKLMKNKGFSYLKKNFRFTLLEHFTEKTDDDFIINRETFWKKVFLTREFGYNQN